MEILIQWALEELHCIGQRFPKGVMLGHEWAFVGGTKTTLVLTGFRKTVTLMLVVCYERVQINIWEWKKLRRAKFRGNQVQMSRCPLSVWVLDRDVFNFPRNDVWQHVQSVANQVGSPKPQCPGFLLGVTTWVTGLSYLVPSPLRSNWSSMVQGCRQTKTFTSGRVFQVLRSYHPVTRQDLVLSSITYCLIDVDQLSWPLDVQHLRYISVCWFLQSSGGPRPQARCYSHDYAF